MVVLAMSVAAVMAWLAGAASAKTTQVTHQSQPVVSASSASVGSSPFSKKDVMVLAVGATALVAFGVGFRRISASLE